MSAVSLHHSVSGPEGAPVVLLGGSLGTNLTMWEPQIEALSRSRRVVCFDHRGHGGSPVPPAPYAIPDLGADVLALMDQLELERASYVGLSIGGMVGIWLGAHAAPRLESLVLICTSAYAPPASRWLDRVATVRAAGTVEVIADAVLGGWFTPDWAREHPREIAAHRAMLAATDPEGYCGCCQALAAMDLRAGLPAVTAPTLVIGGRDDHALPPDEHQLPLARAIPGARLELVADAAHIASAQQPDAVNRLILEHLGDE